MSQYCESLNTSNDDLELLGGKGRSRSNLVSNGFKVPDGFHVTTNAYKTFIDRNGLQTRILSLAKPTLDNGQVSFQKASTAISQLFTHSAVPDDILREISNGYGNLAPNSEAVAVRSSANAEDLPNLSFAGQQETYLNISGDTEVQSAVKKCWASLWTPQALSYRHQNGIDHAQVAMSVVVQLLVPAEIAGILFTANPATGDRHEMVINASYGLGEAVVSGQVTPDTYIVNRKDGSIKESVVGSKEQQIHAATGQGVVHVDVSEQKQKASVLTADQIKQLWQLAEKVEDVYDEVPQDIEWAIADAHIDLLQSRPITNLPVQPIEVSWEVPKPATYVSRRQIVENMPDPISPLFEELYLTKGLESPRQGKSLMIGGGPMFMTVNGYAYQRFDFPVVHEQAREKGLLPVDEAEIDLAEMEAVKQSQSKPSPNKQKSNKNASKSFMEAARERDREARDRDVEMFLEDLNDEDKNAFLAWQKENDHKDFALELAFPKSENPTYVAFNNSEWNDRQSGEWFRTTRPRLQSIRDKWEAEIPSNLSDQRLLEAICEMGIEEGYYWSSNASHTFGVAKSTDDQLQCFLRETLPEHHFISGQFLSGIQSRTMQGNADLFKIAQEIRRSNDLTHLVLVTPVNRLLAHLKSRNDSTRVLELIDAYLVQFGHQGYSMDFVEATQVEDPIAMLTSLKSMVADEDYHPRNQEIRAKKTREEKLAEISCALHGLEYWQFRFRLWLARKYHYLREEVAYMFGYTWIVLRIMATELGERLTEIGTLSAPEHIYFLVSDEIQQAIESKAKGEALPRLGELAGQRLELREARKRHHPPGTLPAEASQIDGIAFKETQIKNEADSSTMRGFPVSSGRVTAPASVITNAADFDKMTPGSILVSPLTTPAWTQLFAHAVGLVTDVGSILAHGSIVAREYGIPAVLGVGNGTKRITHGQVISIDGDQGIVNLDPQEE